MSLDRPLTTLEATAMGIVLKQGPCVAHKVVTQFADSDTFAYRSGAGSIYPLLRRLTEAGLLRLERRKYTITDQGIKALHGWILPPYAPGEIGTNLDVLRSRVYFLELLDRAEVRGFCSEAIMALERLLEVCKRVLAEQKASGDRFGELAMLGTIFETKARLEWMREVDRATSTRD